MDVNMEHGEGGLDTTNKSGQDLMNSDPPSGPMPTTVESQPIQDGHPEPVIPGGTKTKATSASSAATGPPTRQGKERSKYNAIKHGIFSNLPFLHGESKAQFDSLLNGLREYLKPEGTLEEVLVEKLATLFGGIGAYLLRRAQSFQPLALEFSNLSRILLEWIACFGTRPALTVLSIGLSNNSKGSRG